MCFHKVLSFLLRELIFLLFLLSCFSSLSDKIQRGKLVKDGDFVISSGRKFVLGFFSPENSMLRYVGIWYHGIKVKTAVWVANRENPVYGKDGVLKFSNDGNLVILNGQNNVVWSTNVSTSLKNPIAILNDTGDLALYGRIHRNRHTNQPYWQSFDDPTDTYLPETRVYLNKGEHRIITSWKNASDPSQGVYSAGFDSIGSPQMIIWEGSKRRWRSGHWNGVIFIGISGMRELYLYGFKIINEGDEKLYFIYNAPNSSDLERFQLSWKGYYEQRTWKEDLNEWKLMITHPENENECDLYNTCGPFATCDKYKYPICSCLFGFTPKDLDQWDKGNWRDGCIRKTDLHCNSTNAGEKDGFYRVDNVKLPDFVDFVGSEGNEECEVNCLKNCSCVAFSFVTGLNCMMWGNDLVDIQNFVEDGNALFIRLAQSELDRSGSKVKKFVLIAAALVVGMLLAMASILQIHRRRKKLRNLDRNGINSIDYFANFSGAREISIEARREPGTELAYFSFSSIALATDNFALSNKLGHGGFGLVYKGRLPGGEEIAVKRLCMMSGQGLEEFKNEITLIARLQHRNLVRLLGCCLEGVEKILLYEYMPNKSLDSFLFVPDKKILLDWSKRLHIIEGVARGLLYLHRDSRLRVIHRDLKASNILLDEDMNPKISDFGMARIFGGNQNEASTNRVVGTYGYMSPEYAMEGLFSVKSDVYSFGVLLFEIISGRRNTGFRSEDYSNIIGYAWELWENNKAIELLDPTIAESSARETVIRCIHIGILCVQDLAAQRPTMSSVVLMLESENVDLPQPRQPALISIRAADLEMWEVNQNLAPSNDVTMTTIVGR